MFLGVDERTRFFLKTADIKNGQTLGAATDNCVFFKYLYSVACLLQKNKFCAAYKPCSFHTAASCEF